MIYINYNYKKTKIKLKKFLNGYIYPMLFIFLPIKNTKVVFSSYYGEQYSDSPKAVSEKLHRENPQIDIVWLLSDEGKKISNPPSYIRCVQYDSLKASYEVSTARVWVENCRKMGFFTKRKNQIYIQCWHGTPLKKIEKDADDKLPERYKNNAKIDSKNIDLLLSGNEYSTKILRKCFWYYGEIAEWGIPRNDIFFNKYKNAAQNLRNYLGIKDEKIILYAPTFRDKIGKNGLPQLEELKPTLILDSFERYYGKKCILLARFHPNVAKLINKNELRQIYGEKFYEVSEYRDMQELLCGADALITDYSSSFFDFALLKRPIFLFMPDYRAYTEERGFYLDIENIPLNVAKTNSELIKMINNMDEKKSKKSIDNFLCYLGNKEDGDATSRVVKYILENIT